MRSLPYFQPIVDVQRARGVGADSVHVNSKLDRSFVTGCAAARSERAIVEWVESVDDWKVLSDAGCDRAQGSLISGALRESAFAAFLMGHPGKRVSPVLTS